MDVNFRANQLRPHKGLNPKFVVNEKLHVVDIQPVLFVAFAQYVHDVALRYFLFVCQDLAATQQF